MKCNVTVKAITSAQDWFAEYGHNHRPLLCWALTDDGIVGLVLGAGQDARNAEHELDNGQAWTGYVRRAS
jgi:hypothetical protein